ncbi:MAG: CDGSH iron-sulfur domain-containing protein [Clostridiaceae bacterium]|nr:CDGSH iron-sulfur domain-containing protein [Clostridiaceae bacterium]
MDLLDDGRCAYARFCHRNAGNAWELTRNSDDETNKNEAMQAAYECPSGRLAAMDKAGKIYDPEYEPSVNIIQDPQKNVSGGIFVKGNIPIEAADGQIYEPRNRVVLCRCGRSANKPFCDATHIPISFNDK